MSKSFKWCIMLMQAISIAFSISSGTIIGSDNHPDMGALAWAGMFIIISYQVMWLSAKESRRSMMRGANAP